MTAGADPNRVSGGKKRERPGRRPSEDFSPSGDSPDCHEARRSQPIPLRTRRFPESCKARWACHGDVLRTVVASADSPEGGGPDTVTCRDFAVHTASKVGR